MTRPFNDLELDVVELELRSFSREVGSFVRPALRRALEAVQWLRSETQRLENQAENQLRRTK